MFLVPRADTWVDAPEQPETGIRLCVLNGVVCETIICCDVIDALKASKFFRVFVMATFAECVLSMPKTPPVGSTSLLDTQPNGDA